MNIIHDVINENNSIVNPVTKSNNFLTIEYIKKLEKIADFSDLEFGELTVLNLIIQKVKQCHDKFEKQNKKKNNKKN